VRRFDRALVGCGDIYDSRVYECFDAPWWRLDRWLNWWLFTEGYTKGVMSIDGRYIRIRTAYRVRKIRRPIP
jgi:hypothetical protein